MSTEQGASQPRGTRADAEANGKIYLFKKSSTLRATYQVRLLLFRAVQEGTTLVLVVPQQCEFSGPLQLLIEDYPQNLAVERR